MKKQVSPSTAACWWVRSLVLQDAMLGGGHCYARLEAIAVTRNMDATSCFRPPGLKAFEISQTQGWSMNDLIEKSNRYLRSNRTCHMSVFGFQEPAFRCRHLGHRWGG